MDALRSADYLKNLTDFQLPLLLILRICYRCFSIKLFVLARNEMVIVDERNKLGLSIFNDNHC